MRSIQPEATIPLVTILWRQTVARRWRLAIGRDRTYVIGDHMVTLPPGHLLPELQAFSPSYDTYAVALLRAIARGGRLHLVDVGANVGDTAVLALTADEGITVTAVEGNRYFLGYLHRNLRGFESRVTIVEAFVGEPTGGMVYTHDGSTGRFVLHEGEDPLAGPERVTHPHPNPSSGPPPLASAAAPFVSPEQLLSGSSRPVVWKSDTDGQDLPLLVGNWEALHRCDVLWFEFDPGTTRNGTGLTRELADLLKAERFGVVVFDNYGRLMTASRDAHTLVGLAAWQARVSQAPLTPARYFDVWATSDPELWSRLTNAAGAPS